MASRIAANQGGTPFVGAAAAAEPARSVEETTQLPRNRFNNRLIIDAQPADLRPPAGVQSSVPGGDAYQPMHVRQLGAPQTAGVSYMPRRQEMADAVEQVEIPGGACARVMEDRVVVMPDGKRAALHKGDILDDPGAISIAFTQKVPMEPCTQDGKAITVEKKEAKAGEQKPAEVKK
jgi:hypothetical protein